jgi:FKBP-type peptidyl-prolyl cis-trans isomerase SlyD
MPEVVKPGKLVTLTYSITDEQGNLLERNDLPMSYVYGGDTELIGGMDEAIAGHQEGDELTVTVPPSKAFGAHDPSLTFTDDIDNVPHEFRRLGAEVPMQSDAGEQRTFYVTRIADGRLTVDGNHPLAGKTLTVSVKIHEIRDATPDDALSTGIHAVRRMMN